MTDSDLLRRYAEQRDENAFRQIVERHIDLVYAAACRQLAGSGLSEDVTQAVFIVLAKKAGKIDGRVLAGWLVNAARLIAMQAMREEARRKKREQQVALMKEEVFEPGEWERVSPILDEALSRLDQKDRTAVTLRYLEKREMGEVATMMGVSEAAAAKRITRAMGRLRKSFSGKSLNLSSIAIGTMLLEHAHVSAPAGLAGNCIAVAMGQGAAAAAVTTIASAAVVKGTATMAITLASAASTPAILTLPVWGYVVIAAISTSLAIGGYTTVRHFENRPPAAEVYVPTRTDTIRVGILLSQFTATGPSNIENNYGYKDGYLEMYRALRVDPLLDIYPIVEPTTQPDRELTDTLRAEFKGRAALDASDKKQLMTLDVIACQRIWNESPEVLDAIESTVKAGKGLLIGSGLGLNIPGPGGQINRLNGMKEGAWEYDRDAVNCRVLMPHPLLGSLKAGDVVKLEANGEAGILGDGMKGLIGVVEMGDLTPLSSQTVSQSYVFYPVVVGKLGEGKVVSYAFSAWKAIPEDLQKPTGGRFLPRCVRWLSGRPLE